MSSVLMMSDEEREAYFAARKTEYDAFLASQPQTIPCGRHPQIQQTIDPDGIVTRDEHGHREASYKPCPLCEEEKRLAKENERLHHQGVPANLLHATLDNWTPAGEQENANLATVKEFAKKRVGFLVLLGPVGTGKTHLAVAVMRGDRSAMFVKQSTLLRNLRLTYHDESAPDPVKKAQAASLLVLDELGLSSGGRDEFPMLNEILDYRYGERNPTILTSNLTLPELRDILGERITDRLREAVFAILTFAGPSHREQRREAYLK